MIVMVLAGNSKLLILARKRAKSFYKYVDTLRNAWLL